MALVHDRRAPGLEQPPAMPGQGPGGQNPQQLHGNGGKGKTQEANRLRSQLLACYYLLPGEGAGLQGAYAKAWKAFGACNKKGPARGEGHLAGSKAGKEGKEDPSTNG